LREQAAQELDELAELAEPALRRGLAHQPTPEARRRIAHLLQKRANEFPAPGQLRALRTIEVFERIGSSEAKKVLEQLASGASKARLTRDAKASLARLAKRPVPKP
jgi:hypothetical protein